MTTMRTLLFAAALVGMAAPVSAQSMAGGSMAGQGGFGRALAIANNELLVGESNNQARSGIVYVYRKVNGKWTEAAKLTPRDGAASNGFGRAIAVSGNVMIVSASAADNGKGAGYIFQRDARGGWNQVAVLANPDTAGSQFGSAVAIEGDIAVIGAPTLAKQSGAVYVYRRNGNTWTQDAKLVSPETKEQMFFGQGVGIHRGRILVGETGYNERTGAVHVFERTGNAWTSDSKLTANGLQKGDRYGMPIVTSNDRVLVGATGFASASGAVFAFIPDPQFDFKEAGRLLAHDGRQADAFGSAIAFDGVNYWIGAPRANGLRGTLYHIWRSTEDSTLTGAERLNPRELAAQSFFGGAVAAQGNLAAASIQNANFGLGAVVIYEFANGKWSETKRLDGQDDRIPTIATGRKECVNGKSASTFACSNVELMAYLSVPDIGGGAGVQLNDIWGWTDPETGKEWAIVGRMDGTSFVDVSNPEKPRYVANLPMTKGANAAAWRDMKVYKNHVYIVADGSGPHGMQVFDLTRLRAMTTPQIVEPDLVYRKVNSAHNIVMNEETGFVYIVGASGGGETCGGGLHMISLADPKNPEFAGCFADPQTGRSATGYSHDAQCVVYRGPDEQYKGREICLGSNETMLSIADVTDKKSPKAISRASYPNVGYSHQGWLDGNHQYFYMNDELDELSGTTPNTRTIVWDLTDLDDPQVANMYLSPTAATDHNLYIKGDTMYQSHYVAGLRVVDIKDRRNPVEIGFFDTVPYGENKPGFGGSWSNYPYFKSGIIIATSGNEGLFILKKQDPKPIL
jgi:choice-of-anchor B domain-containing protein